jgi:hypothetical protein
MKYTIVSGYGSSAVADAVNEHLEKGWHLYGNLAVAATSEAEGGFYAQALTKNEPGNFTQSDLNI